MTTGQGDFRQGDFEQLFHGRQVERGVVFDVPLIGEREARDRVLRLWQPGSQVRRLPEGRWLLVLAQPIALRAEQAPGRPQRIDDDGTVTWLWRGRPSTARLARLPEIPVADWIDLAGLPPVWLAPVQLSLPEPVAPQPFGRPEPPDLRRRAGIGRDRRAEQVQAELAAEAGRRGRAGAGRGGPVGRGSRWRGLGWRGFGWRGADRDGADRDGADRSGADARDADWGDGPYPGRGWSGPGQRILAALFRRTPLSSTVGRRQARYLRELARQFERKDYEAALRGAITLGEEGGGGRLSMRLPTPRQGPLRPSLTRLLGGRGMVIGPLDGFLRPLYLQAAAELERQGKIDEAAFVYADLIGAVQDAVQLLERHGRFEAAAELAQGRGMPPDLVVRLWWRAGRRDRAVAFAVARGAFPSAVAALEAIDPAGAVDLRAEWVRWCRRGGDHLGAVQAAWPVPSLREGVLPELQIGIALGGPAAGELLAMMVTHRPTEAGLALVDSLLTSPDPDLNAARTRFVLALADLRADPAAADRRLATAALRTLVREEAIEGRGSIEERGSTEGRGSVQVRSATRGMGGATVVNRVEQALRERSDPLAAADLPKAVFRAPSPAQSVQVLGGEPGPVPVRDAVALAGGVLVALGELGVRLLTADGRVRARWGVPTDGLVVADHGGSVLLLNRGETIVDVHTLDLVTRRVRHWSTLSLRRVLPSYDGTLLIGQDDDGLVFLDTTADRPRVSWRELGPGDRVLDLARSAQGLSALIVNPDVVDGRPEIWSWSLPDLVLRGRTTFDLTDVTACALAANGGFLVMRDRDEANASLGYRAPGGVRLIDVPEPGPDVDQVQGPAQGPGAAQGQGAEPGQGAEQGEGEKPGIPVVLGVRATAERLLIVTRRRAGELGIEPFDPSPGTHAPTLRLLLPNAPDSGLPAVREHSGRFVVSDRGGRVIAVDLTTRAVLASLVIHP